MAANLLRVSQINQRQAVGLPLSARCGPVSFWLMLPEFTQMFLNTIRNYTAASWPATSAAALLHG
jgi:hypothetical protein